jgi:hypothetical protein
MTGGGTSGTVTINHADTSSLSGTYGSTSNGTKIDQITVDARGHVTAITTGPTGDIQGVTAGSGLSGGGTSGTVTLSHADTSAQASVNNSGGTVIQDITLDTYGHLTGITSYNLDGRYYTESEADSRFVNVTGDTMTGNLQFGDDNEGIKFYSDNYLRKLAGTGMVLTVDSSRPMADLLQFERGSGGTKYGAFHEGYHPNADKWTTARTLSLTGDASGSVSWDGSGNASLSVTVADDSHNHTIANVDGLQTALDGKLSTSGKAADADLLDGQQGSYYYPASNPNGYTTYTANQALNTTSNPTFNDVYVADQILHSGDTDTYMQFHAGDQWRVVTGGAERLEVNNSQVTSTEPVHAPSFHGDGSNLTGIAAGAGGGGSDEIFWENGQNVTTNYTITNGKNAMSAGPITINSGVTVTVGAGETWTVV